MLSSPVVVWLLDGLLSPIGVLPLHSVRPDPLAICQFCSSKPGLLSFCQTDNKVILFLISNGGKVPFSYRFVRKIFSGRNFLTFFTGFSPGQFRLLDKLVTFKGFFVASPTVLTETISSL